MEKVSQDNTAGTNIEDKAETISNQLQIKLPGQGLPIIVRLIALFTLIGGLGIMETVFVDIVRPQTFPTSFYLLRITVGILALLTAYLIVIKSRLALWIFGAIPVIGLFINPIVSILPGAILIYLLFQRNQFKPSMIDTFIQALLSKIKK